MTLSSREVFEILAKTHAHALKAFILSAVRRPQDADDIFQETLMAAWKGLSRYDRNKPFAPWLRGIAFNIISDWRRRRGRSSILCDEPTLELIGEHYGRLERAHPEPWDDPAAALRSCMEELGAEDQEVIELRYSGSRSCESIAGELHQGLEWVKKRLQRARAQLAMCVEGRLASGEKTS